MEVFHYTDVEVSEVQEEGAAGVNIRWVLDERQGANNFVMRVFDMEPGGYTPRHAHPWEHEVFILEGQGQVWGDGAWHDFGPGSVVFVPPDEEHQFKNNGTEEVKFICLVPKGGCPVYR